MTISEFIPLQSTEYVRTNFPLILEFLQAFYVWQEQNQNGSLNYTYYIDPINGSDNNSGTSQMYPWKTTTIADSVLLTGTQSIGYNYNNTWILYRTLNETADMSTLPINIITGTTDQF